MRLLYRVVGMAIRDALAKAGEETLKTFRQDLQDFSGLTGGETDP
jgi:hypothetical protein